MLINASLIIDVFMLISVTEAHKCEIFKVYLGVKLVSADFASSGTSNSVSKK